MNAEWMVDRRRLRSLLRARPDWSLQDLADAVGRSRSWVKKWRKRLREAGPDDDTVLQGRASARHTPPPRLSQVVIERILAIRDHPPHGLNRIPGPKAILYYLQQEATTSLQGERLPRSSRTIWRILRQHQRIVSRPGHAHHAVERPGPMQSWQLDFKDASTVPAEVDGKQQHVVEVLDAVDVGTSILIAAEARADFTMASAIESAAAIVTEKGLPDRVTLDRDPRSSGESRPVPALLAVPGGRGEHLSAAAARPECVCRTLPSHLRRRMSAGLPAGRSAECAHGHGSLPAALQPRAPAPGAGLWQSAAARGLSGVASAPSGPTDCRSGSLSQHVAWDVLCAQSATGYQCHGRDRTLLCHAGTERPTGDLAD